MANVTCAISKVRFKTTHLNHLHIPHTAGYMHPIFALDRELLYPLYDQYCDLELSDVDSYLLFLAFLHSSGHVRWLAPADLNPSSSRTQGLIANNIAELISVLERTDLLSSNIAFAQPSYKVRESSSSLSSVSSWIKAWDRNIRYFYTYKASQLDTEALQKLENRITKQVRSGERPEKYAALLANWAAKVGEFPPEKQELWMHTIRSCFSMTKMFNTPLSLLNEIKAHIELNIEAVAIHFHTLSEVLIQGIKNHEDYLGTSTESLGYALLPTLGENGSELTKSAQESLATLHVKIAKAGTIPPRNCDYKTSFEFLKANLAYSAARNLRVMEARKAKATPKPVAAFTEESLDVYAQEDAEDSMDRVLDVAEGVGSEDLAGLTITSTDVLLNEEG